MKYTLLIVLQFVFFTQMSRAQKDTTQLLVNNIFDVVWEQSDATFMAYVTKGENGYDAKIYFGKNNLVAEGTFKDKNLKIKHGYFKFYDANTPLVISEGNFEYNIKNGTWKSWYENKQLKDSGRMYYGMKVGKWKKWHENGTLFTNSKYADSFATPLSITKGYTKEEKPTAIAQYLERYYEETKIGLWLTYHPNGTLKDSITFLNGDKNGIAKTWYDNGKIESVGSYQNNKEEGIWNWYHENGQPATWEKYQRGKIKEMKCYDRNGNFVGDYCSIYKPAVFPGGISKFEEYVDTQIKYPEPLKGSNLETVVTCYFTINKKGAISSLRFERQPFNIYFSNYIKEVLYKMPAWEPAIMHNREQEYEVTLHIPFSEKAKEYLPYTFKYYFFRTLN